MRDTKPIPPRGKIGKSLDIIIDRTSRENPRYLNTIGKIRIHEELRELTGSNIRNDGVGGSKSLLRHQFRF